MAHFNSRAQFLNDIDVLTNIQLPPCGDGHRKQWCGNRTPLQHDRQLQTGLRQECDPMICLLNEAQRI